MYIMNLVRNIGKSYKDIYSKNNRNGMKELRNKYIDIEKHVYHHAYNVLGKDLSTSIRVNNLMAEDLTIVYHGAYHRDFGGRLHLQFDAYRPVIHLISYDTDVADYNIKTGLLFEGYQYSPTTTGHMADFRALFGYRPSQVMKGTEKLVHDKVLNTNFYTGLPVDLLITKNSNDVNWTDTLAQVPILDTLFMSVYKYSKNHKVFKYQLKQIDEMLTSLVDEYDYFDTLIQATSLKQLNEYTKKWLSDAIVPLNTNNTIINYLSDDVDVNQYYDKKKGKFVERNLTKSYKIMRSLLNNLEASVNNKKVA